VYPVSAASHQGLRELSFAMAGVVARSRADRQAERPAATRITIRPPQPVGGPEFTVRQTGDPSGSADRAWRVQGTKPERWVRQTDFSNDEAVGFLADRLNRLGVEDRLLELGAQAGEPVLIGDADDVVVFDFRPMVTTGAELLGRRGEDERFGEERPAARRRREIQAAMESRAAGETRADVARRLDGGGAADDPAEEARDENAGRS
jgi:GTP-binding protein